MTAIGFLAVITASVTSAMVKGSRRRLAASDNGDVARRLDVVNERLARIEAALG